MRKRELVCPPKKTVSFDIGVDNVLTPRVPRKDIDSVTPVDEARDLIEDERLRQRGEVVDDKGDA